MIVPNLEIIALIFTLTYVILGVIVFLRRQSSGRLLIWGLAFLGSSAVWQWSMLWVPPAGGPVRTIQFVLLLLCAFLLLQTTAEYLDQVVPAWIGPAVLATAGITVSLNLLPLVELPRPFFLRFTPLGGSLVALISILWLFLFAFSWTLQGYKRTPFPWHANRYLYWLNIILLLLAGELLWMVNNGWLVLAGLVLRLIAAAGFGFGVVAYVRFDVRTRYRRWLTQLLLFGIALLPATGLYYFFEMILPDYPPILAAVLAIGSIGLLLVLFAPSYRRLESWIYRHLIGDEFKESVVLREYSQAIAGALEIESLAAAVFDQLNRLFGVTRGALVLAKAAGEEYIFEAIPAAGTLSREPRRFEMSNPLVNLLLRTSQPVLQYEIDFNPIYAPVRRESQNWLKGLEMEIYAPIRSNGRLKGFIALGPKRSGYTFRANELELIQLFADQTVAALDNATLYRELGDQNEKVRQLNENLLRQNERLETMDQVKSDFITIASHELRTPLTQVKGYTDILASLNEENALTRDQARQIINQIERATENLEQLISAMLDASQIDVDEMKMNLTTTEIRSVLRLAQEPLSQSLKQRRIQLDIRCPNDLPALQADFKRLVQAFTNILGNAVKYTPDYGRITIHCRLLTTSAAAEEIDGQLPDGEQFIEISITDTGIGIDPAYHQLIFEKFFRLGDPHLHSTGSTKFMGAGPGLGLTIARGVVEGHGGRIWVESAGEDRGRLPGSTFTIILPVEPTIQPANPTPSYQLEIKPTPSPLSDDSDWQPEPLVGD